MDGGETVVGTRDAGRGWFGRAGETPRDQNLKPARRGGRLERAGAGVDAKYAGVSFTVSSDFVDDDPALELAIGGDDVETRGGGGGSAHRRAVRFAQRFELALVVRRRLSLGPLGVS